MLCYEQLHAEMLEGEAHPWQLPKRGLQRPPWLKVELFRRGQTFFFDNFVECLRAFLIAIIGGFNVTRLAVPLLLTERSNSPDKALHRYLETIKYLILWFRGDVFQEGSAAHESLVRVNHLHTAAANMMIQRQKDYPGRYFTQYDMMLVQFAFVHIIVVYPADLGIRCPDADLLGYIHFWRAVGHGLGMEERWNLCTSDDLLDVRTKCKTIEWMVALPAIMESPKELQILGDVFIEGFRHALPYFPFTKGSVIMFILEIFRRHSHLELTAPPGLKVTFRDRVLCWWYRLSFGFHYYLPHWLTSWANRIISRFVLQRLSIT